MKFKSMRLNEMSKEERIDLPISPRSILQPYNLRKVKQRVYLSGVAEFRVKNNGVDALPQ